MTVYRSNVIPLLKLLVTLIEVDTYYIHHPIIVAHLVLLTVIRYYRNKFNVTWDDDESRVSYHLDTYYVLDKEKSIGDPKNYTIITLNVPLLVNNMSFVKQSFFVYAYMYVLWHL